MTPSSISLPAFNREEARRLGAKLFFAAKPCRRKHNPTIRYTSSGQCIQCAAITCGEWAMENHERKLEIDRTYYRMPGNKEKNIQSTAARRKANPQQRRDSDNAAYLRNPAPFRERTRRWEESHPKAVCLRQSRRRAKKRNAPGNHTMQDLRDILKSQGSRCAYFRHCGTNLTPKTAVFDHIIALENGGSNARNNLQATCRPCNASKQDKDPIIWVRQKMGLLI